MKYRMSRRKAPKSLGFRTKAQYMNWIMKKRRRRKIFGPRGGMVVTRKFPLYYACSSGVLGQFKYSPPSASNVLIEYGAMVVNPLLGPGIYDLPFVVHAQLDQVAQPADFTALFDQYKINWVKLRIQLGQNVYNTAPATGSTIPMPYIEYETDYDSAGPPDVTTFRQNMGIKTKYFNSVSNRLYLTVMSPKPQIGTDTTGSGPVLGIVPTKRSWVNCVYDDVPHYGIRGVIRNLYAPNVAGLSPLTIDATMGISLKDVL